MKSNLAATILILACLGLGVALWSLNQKHTNETQYLGATIDKLSNSVTQIRDDRDKQTIANETLKVNLAAARLKASNDLADAKLTLAAVSANLEKWQTYAISHSNTVLTLESRLAQQALINATLQTNLTEANLKAANDLAAIQATLATAYTNLNQARDDAKKSAAAADTAIADASAAIAEKDKKIAELEHQKTDLEKQSNDLLASMTNLQARAAATQKKLDSAEGDQKLLMSELTLIEAQKEELQKKFTDVAALKTQVRTLQDNIAISRRVEWIERGLYEASREKGGELLITPPPPGSSVTNVSLDVEVHQGGAARINSSSATNATPTNKPTARAPSR